MMRSDQLHVLHVLNSAQGGSALSTFQLIEALRKKGVKSSLICFNNATAEQERAIGELMEGRVLFIPLYWTNKRTRVRWWKRPLLELYESLKTGRGYRFQGDFDAMIKTYRVNLVHTSTLVNREGAIAAARNNLPHVWHVRELIGPGFDYQFPHFKKWISFVDKNAGVLVANSSVTRTNLLKYFPDHKVRYIPNGIAVGDYTPKRHHAAEKLVVGMVANVTSRLKNHEFFIRTAAKSDPAIEFRIYGALPGEKDGYFTRLKSIIAKDGLEPRVIFMGPRQNAADIMKEIDVLFHPNGMESFGRIFIEAMAGGIPILAVNQGGALELVKEGQNGFLVGNNDTLTASARLAILKDPTERNRLGAHGRRRVEADYALDRTSAMISDLYIQTVAQWRATQ